MTTARELALQYKRRCPMRTPAWKPKTLAEIKAKRGE